MDPSPKGGRGPAELLMPRSCAKYSSLDQAELWALAANLGVSLEPKAHYRNRVDDILSMAFLAFFNSGVSVLFGLDLWFLQGLGRLYQDAFREIPLTAIFEVHSSDYLE